ncbi:MAG: AbrB/MazE/SpoVT family DNA-binding domain-containing protein [Gammaproteobacteria bacterium]
MSLSALTSKGQVTIPAEIRKALQLRTGDKIGFLLEDGHVILFKKIDNIEAAFGICKPKRKASLKDIENAISSRGGKNDRD